MTWKTCSWTKQVVEKQQISAHFCQKKASEVWSQKNVMIFCFLREENHRGQKCQNIFMDCCQAFSDRINWTRIVSLWYRLWILIQAAKGFAPTYCCGLDVELLECCWRCIRLSLCKVFHHVLDEYWKLERDYDGPKWSNHSVIPSLLFQTKAILSICLQTFQMKIPMPDIWLLPLLILIYLCYILPSQIPQIQVCNWSSISGTPT